MGYVDDAFGNLKSNLEITPTEQKLAGKRHVAIRDHVRAAWSLDDDFLTGSYRRGTKTKRLKDVDIFVVIDPNGAQAKFRDQAPAKVLEALLDLMVQKWSGSVIDGMAVVVPYGKEDEVTSMEVVPAFKRAAGGYVIPDAVAGSWIATNPKTHHELSTAKNKDCDERYVPFVKMVKAINRELKDAVAPSFLLEVMALDLVKAPFGRYQDEIIWFMATAADQLNEVWDDPAGLGGNVNTSMTAAQRRDAIEALREAQSTAERASDLEDNGQDRAAVEEWRRLFKNRMPRP